MKKLLTYGAGAILACACLQAAAQEKKLASLTKEDFIADFRLAVDILKKQHPNPYKFIDSATFMRRVDSLMDRMGKEQDMMTSLQYSPIYLVRDVHTSLRLSNDNSRELYGNLRFFPYPVIIERGRIFVNIKGATIPYGAEILSINNKPVKDILQSLSTSAYSDGFIPTGMDRLYPDFQVTFSLLSPHQASYPVTWTAPGSKETRKTTLEAANPTDAFHATRQSVFPFNLLQRAYYIYNDYDDATKTGRLTVNTFALNEQDAYKEFSEFFREVKKRNYQQVIIDVRSNGGGDPAISALLYSFMAEAPFRNVYNYRTRNIDVAYPEYAVADNGRRLSDEDIQGQKNFFYQRFDKDSSGFYVGNARLKDGLMENFPPDKDAFHGKVFVLTGGGTVSAATYFATLVQKNKRGVIIGKETGSGEAATTAAWFLRYLLPRTKCVLTVPRSELNFFNATKDNGRGIMPDKEVPMDKFMGYVQADKDPEISYTMELIRGGH
ncbi:Peptidase family S41 [Chitinophaga eiseniae]|uniref:Peptidase family S41 n=1 Tax=Chitinophaga eiseniae TaxID=634771 RepID=A0A1T4TCG5_9BACT|nr:S41 family peptidase [Chitinophaga eiseniae]SKA38097.1 Peptidase family S41 [Chitinophaga eiseniae]